MSLTTKEFLANLSKGAKVKASATHKHTDHVRTVTLRQFPTDETEASFIESAAVNGVDASVKVKDDDERGRNYTGKDIMGEPALNLACDVLGVPTPKNKTEKPKRERKSETATPIVTAPTEGAPTS